MKRLLIIPLIVATFGVSSVVADASPKASPNASAEAVQVRQILGDLNRAGRRKRRNHNNGNVRYETRIVHKGNKTYRDTYRITYKNGKEKVKRVSHVRIY